MRQFLYKVDVSIMAPCLGTFEVACKLPVAPAVGTSLA